MKYLALITIFLSLIIVSKEYSHPENIDKDASSLIETPNASSETKPKVVILEETGVMKESDDNNWWLNSGAYAYFYDGIISTVHGELDVEDTWRSKYYINNALETDDGLHPQNIFRLVNRNTFTNVQQSMYFKINKYIKSKDIHRSGSNGVLFFHHYQDGNNLYYAGLRVDGAAVIKKKVDGKYYTMAYKPIYLNSSYDREKNPNLLPTNKWIGIKSVVMTIGQDKVNIKLFADLDDTGEWTLLLDSTDDGTQYDKNVISQEGYVGIRSDFMDVEFRDYLVQLVDVD